MNLAVLALGKLGGRGMDYDSDLDVILAYDDERPVPDSVTHAEFYSSAVELFVNTLSSMTRNGNLYRVDLRLRPYGSKGLSAMSSAAFLEYMRETAAVWELLAFVKLRAVGGDTTLGLSVENETRYIIHNRALSVAPDELRQETLRVRLALQQQHARTRRGKEIDIKYGSGGMLDVYFAMRYLQLRHNVPDDDTDRSTTFMLERLNEVLSHESGVGGHESRLAPQNSRLTTLDSLREGYEFLSALDHNLRLTVGRTTRLPLANHAVLATISTRMNLASPADLLEQLTIHRLAIRAAFENVLSEPPA